LPLVTDGGAQVWNLVAGDNPSLTKPQFYSTLRLISLAQVQPCRVTALLCSNAVYERGWQPSWCTGNGRPAECSMRHSARSVTAAC